MRSREGGLRGSDINIEHEVSHPNLEAQVKWPLHLRELVSDHWLTYSVNHLMKFSS